MKSKKRGEIETRKLISAIIVVVVVVVVVLGAASQAQAGGVIDNLIKLFPDFFKTNSSVKPPVECPSGFSEVGYVDGKGNINIQGRKTNLYLDTKNIKVKVPLTYNLADLIVGYVINGSLNIDYLFDIDKRELEYRQFFPEEKDMRLLRNAKIFEGTLCLVNKNYEMFVQVDKCILTCDIVDGICSASLITNKIAYKQLNCPGGQLCYVDESYEKLSSDSLSIINGPSPGSEYSKFIDNNGHSKQVISDVVSTNVLQAIIFERVGLKLFTSSKISYCYSFDSDKSDKDLSKGYQIIDINEKDPYVNYAYSNDFSYSGDKFLQFAAWNDKSNQKVIKRWKFNNSGFPNLKGYEKGEIITNNEFGYKISNSKVGSRFYIIGVDRTWEYGKILSGSGLKTTSDYKIEIEAFPVTGTEIACIYARDRSQGAQGLTESWHSLYCNKAAYCNLNYKLPYCIDKDKISNTLLETFDKSCCWQF